MSGEKGWSRAWWAVSLVLVVAAVVLMGLAVVWWPPAAGPAAAGAAADPRQVLWNSRGLDLVLQAAIVFAAALGVLVLFRTEGSR